MRNFAARNPTDTDITKVAVFDPENKIVGYSGTFTQGVRDIISVPEWGGVYILGNDGSVSGLSSVVIMLIMLTRSCSFYNSWKSLSLPNLTCYTGAPCTPAH